MGPAADIYAIPHFTASACASAAFIAFGAKTHRFHPAKHTDIVFRHHAVIDSIASLAYHNRSLRTLGNRFFADRPESVALTGFAVRRPAGTLQVAYGILPCHVGAFIAAAAADAKAL